MRILIIALLTFLSFLCHSQNCTSFIHAYDAIYVSNYDGDTFRAIVRRPNNQMGGKSFRYSKRKIRLFACDTYELRSKDPNEKFLAYKAKRIVAHFLSKHKFVVVYKHKDRHGRWVCDVILEDGRTLESILRDQELLSGKYENYRNKIYK